MLKIAGAALLVLAATALGTLQTARLYERTRLLEASMCLVRRTDEQIRYAATPLKELCARLAAMPELRSLRFLEGLEAVPAGELHARFRQAVEVFGRQHALCERDVALLCEFGAALGTSDVEGQRAACAQYAALLAEQRDAARRVEREKGRLYTLLGGIGGLLLALLMW